MTAHTSWRRRSASVLATATAVLLAASGALMAPAAAFAEEAPAADAVTPSVTVSKTADIDPAGETITVNGSGFLPNAPLTDGVGRPPLAGKFGGAYVAFGKYADAWAPSTGAPAASRKNFATNWAVSAEHVELIGGAAANAIELRPDGTFTASVTVEKTEAAELAEGNFGIYTYAGGGAKYAPFETYTPITFGTEVVAPSAQVTPSVTSASDAGLTVAVAADGLPTDITGLYAAMIVKGSDSSMEMGGDYPAFAQPFPTVQNGATSFSFDAAAAKLDRSQQYEVLLWKQHSNPSAETIYGRADVQISEANWDAVFPTVAPVTASAKATVSATKNGPSIKVAAKDLPADITDMYAAVIIKGTESEMTNPNSKYAAFGLPFPKVTNGTAEFTLQAAKKDLDRTKQYELFLWKKHADLIPENTYARAAVPVTAAQWNTVFPTVAPKIPFTDMKSGDKFYKEISWMYTSKLSTGTKQADGTVKYLPKENVTREAMAAFLFRQYAEAGYKAPAKSPFTDVKTSDKFYKEIAWMKDAKISTGTKQPNGTVKYLPKDSITREAMAAFMYRIDEGTKPATPKVSPFSDMKPGDKFFKEIAWMHSSGLSTGNKQPSGKPTYAPKSNVTREAMAAFLYRAKP